MSPIRPRAAISIIVQFTEVFEPLEVTLVKFGKQGRSSEQQLLASAMRNTILFSGCRAIPIRRLY